MPLTFDYDFYLSWLYQNTVTVGFSSKFAPKLTLYAHDYISSGCKNMVCKTCRPTVFIGPPCTVSL